MFPVYGLLYERTSGFGLTLILALLYTEKVVTVFGGENE